MNSHTYVDHDSFLLQLLHFAGWQLRIDHGVPTRIRAARDGVHLEVTGSSLAQAAGIMFARAMRSRAARPKPKPA